MSERAMLIIGAIVLFFIAVNTFAVAGRYYASGNTLGAIAAFIAAFGMILGAAWSGTQATEKEHDADEG